jgi:hypothetical protein
MNYRFSLCALFLAAALGVAVHAHPGSGIVVSEDGTVYFADVSRRTIWKCSPDGTLAPLLRDHWTHDLKLTRDGILYYEVEGPSNGSQAPCSLWRLNPKGEPERLIAFTHDRSSFAGEPFAVDGSGNIYFSHMVRHETDKWRALVRKRTPDGTVTTLAGSLDGPLYRDGPSDKASFRIITAMTAVPGRSIYVLDRDRLRNISPDGEVRTIASGLIDDDPSDPPETRGPRATINRLYGVCVTERWDSVHRLPSRTARDQSDRGRQCFRGVSKPEELVTSWRSASERAALCARSW